MKNDQMPKTIKILGINGSPLEGATAYCVKEALSAASSVPGVETEYLSLVGKKIIGCEHCNACKEYYQRKGKDHYYCKQKDDVMEMIRTYVSADGFIVGTPIYMNNVPGILMDFYNRMYCLYHLPKQVKPYAVGGAIAVAEDMHGGQDAVLEVVLNFLVGWDILLYGGSVGRGASVWAEDESIKGPVKDKIGLEKVRALGRDIAEGTLTALRGYYSQTA